MAGFLTVLQWRLAYWWLSSGLILSSFYFMRDRFFYVSHLFLSAMLVPLFAFLLCYIPLFFRPEVKLAFLWKGYVFYIFSMGLMYLLDRLAVFGNAFSRDRQVAFHAVFLTGGVIMSVVFANSLTLFLCSSGVLLIGAGYGLGKDLFLQWRRDFVDLSGSLSLAIGVSWLYSFFMLVSVTFFGLPMAQFFFCDCLKTMGVVMLSDWMQGKVLDESNQLGFKLGVELNEYLQAVIPSVIVSGYVASALWACLLPQAGLLMPIRVFCTVLICACPCVITLASPLIVFSYGVLQLNRPHQAVPCCVKAKLKSCLKSNLQIVSLYYVLSVAMASGGSYLLFGVWMGPQTAGVMMLGGQIALLLNSLYHVSGIVAQSRKQSRYNLFLDLCQRQWGRSSVLRVCENLPCKPASCFDLGSGTGQEQGCSIRGADSGCDDRLPETGSTCCCPRRMSDLEEHAHGQHFR
ncbi:MAG: hypothetical protein VX737_03330 [Pseudomonadota bacterium]|nr:hypothetical protein [Pseudomonadota bacterium]